MISSVGSGAVFSSALLSGNQSLKEKLFTQLDTNGDGGIDKAELDELLSKAASSRGAGAPDSADLFSSIDADGDGAITESELSDGAKTLFDQLRTQLIAGAAKGTENAFEKTFVEKPDTEELFAKIDANGNGSIDQDELGSFMESNGAPRLQRLLDHYRTTATAV
jgi:Ca2+-binding EF-hand superfamily protein